VRCGTVPYGTAGGMWRRVVPYGTKLRGQISSAAALDHKHTHSFGIKLSCELATGLCQLLANLLCCQDLFSVCDNRYGDMIPCFIAGSLVVKSYVPICVPAVRVNHASIAV